MTLLAGFTVIGMAIAANYCNAGDDEVASFANALRANDLIAARDLARAAGAKIDAQQTTNNLDAASWHNRAGYASILMDDEAQAKIDFDRACEQAKLEPMSSAIELNCRVGIAFVQFFGGDQPTGAQQAGDILTTLRGRKDLASATVLANLILATDALTKTDLVNSEKYLDEAVAAFNQLGPETQPALASMLARTFSAVGMQYYGNAKESAADRVFLRAVDVHASSVGHDSPALLATLSAVSVFLSDPQAARRISLWTIELAMKDQDYEKAHASVQSAIMGLADDDALQSLWNWQAKVEKEFGVSSLQAGEGLIDISEFLFRQADNDNAITIRDKGLKLIEAKVGKGSPELKKAESAPQYQLYVANNKALGELQSKLDAIVKAVPSEPSDDQANDTANGEQENVDSSDNINPPSPDIPKNYCETLKEVIQSATGQFSSILGPRTEYSWTARVQLSGWNRCSVEELDAGVPSSRYYSCYIEPFVDSKSASGTLKEIASGVESCLGSGWIPVDEVDSKGNPRKTFSMTEDKTNVELRVGKALGKKSSVSIDVNLE
ncbi:hypothetical protein NKH28_31350 [Mesorhizobium sp. M1227]|uniref:hypothetical protein n=1 Tax=Mesorhizobium sp. M1227 TaxID=2957071 RepID=UPI0033375982